jgi:hypothetical protein
MDDEKYRFSIVDSAKWNPTAAVTSAKSINALDEMISDIDEKLAVFHYRSKLDFWVQQKHHERSISSHKNEHWENNN